MRLFRLADFFNDSDVNNDSCGMTIDLFLDQFYTTPCLFCFLPEPDWSPNLSKERIALVVTKAHRLCNDYYIPIPSWVMRKSYNLDEPYYLHRPNTRIHDYVTFNALSEGVLRNVFVTKDILKRV